MGQLELIDTLSGHTGRVWSVNWHPNGTILSSCGEDKTIRLWGREGSKWALKTILTDGHQRTIRETAWSPCGNYLASASFDATTAIWDRKSGQFECIATLEGHENEVKSVAWSVSGHFLATCSRDKTVWVWEVGDDDEYECAAVINAHTQDVKRVAWHPHVDLLASASYDNTVKLFKEDVGDDEWTNICKLASHESTVWSLSFDKMGTRLVTCSDDKTLKIWKEHLPNNEEGVVTPGNDPVWKCVCTLSGHHERTIYDVSWCHHTDLIATGGADDTIRIFKEASDSDENQPTFDLVETLHCAHSQDINAVRWNPELPGILATASDDGTVKIWSYNE